MKRALSLLRATAEVVALLLGLVPAFVAGAMWLWGKGHADVALFLLMGGVMGFVGGVAAAPRLRQYPKCVRLSRRRLADLYQDYLRRWKKRVHAPASPALRDAPVETVMSSKSSVIAVRQTDDGREVLDQLLERMARLRDDRLPIACVLENDRLVGVITPSDIVAKLGWFHPRGHLPAAALMTRSPFTVEPTQSWGDAENFRKENDIASGLPVVDQSDILVGFLPPKGKREFVGR